VLAAAQSTADDDLRDYLVEATGLEQVAVLAYSSAADARGAQPVLRKTLLAFRDQEQAHANAWRTALDSLGFDAPDPPSSPADTDVFSDVDGLSDDAAKRLTGLLDDLDKLTKPDELLTYLAELERAQLAYYVGDAPDLDSEDLATTSAEVAGCQAEHLVVLRQALGDSPAKSIEAPATAG
jgi:rubrerythrin